MTTTDARKRAEEPAFAATIRTAAGELRLRGDWLGDQRSFALADLLDRLADEPIGGLGGLAYRVAVAHLGGVL
jgi:hypothetical protein